MERIALSAPAFLRKPRTLILLGVVLALLGGIVTAWRAGPYSFVGYVWGAQRDHSDFTVYLAAGHAVLEGTDIYQAKNQRGLAYVYPPPLAIVMAPLSRLPVPWAVFIGYAGSLGLILLAFRWCARLACRDLDHPGPIYALLPLALVAPYLSIGLLRGQASVPMAALVVGAIYYESCGFSLRGAVCLAGAVLLKVFPLALLPYFAWRRRWRFCAFAVLALIVGGLVFPAIVFGPDRAVSYLVEWVHVVGQPALASPAQRVNSPLYSQLLQWHNVHDQSMYAVIGRLVSRYDPARVPHVRLIAGVVLGAMLFSVYTVGRRVAGRARLAVIAAFLVWMLLASPIAEKHYFTMLLLPFFAVSAEALADERVCRHIARILIALFLLGGVVALLPKQLMDPLWRDGWLCWSCLLLWAGLLAISLRRRRPETFPVVREPKPLQKSGMPTARSISLILPMFNESACVESTLGSAVTALRRHFHTFEIIVVDDASTDGCAEKVREWSNRDPAVKLIRLAHNQRFGGALRAGFEAAGGDLLVYTDFDLPVPLDCLPDVLDECGPSDVLTGYVSGVSKHASVREAVISRVYNLLVRAAFGLRLRDINFGFKALPRSVWAVLRPVSESPFIGAEMLIKALRLGYRVVPVEMGFCPRKAGVSHMRRFDVITATLRDMVRVWWGIGTGRIPSPVLIDL